MWSQLLVVVLYVSSISARRGFSVHFLSAKSNTNFKSEFLPRVPIGLRNLANTCYMNSVVQSLYNTALFDRLNNCKLIEGSTGWHLKNLFDEMGKHSGLDTRPLSRSMGVNINIQEDAEEFILKLLDKISSSVSEKRTQVTDIFEFDMMHTVDCTNINHSSSRKQKYTDISLDIVGSNPTLSECLGEYFTPELLKGDNLYKTSTHGYQEAIKSVGLMTAPEELIVHLKRFSYDADTNDFAKVLNPVDIPLSLNLSKYVHIDAIDDTKKSAVYEISSVIVHDGDSLDYGHYFTLIRRPLVGSGGGSVWYKVNDHVVTVVSEEEALATARGTWGATSSAGTRGGDKVACEGGVCRRVERLTCFDSSRSGSSKSAASAYLVFYSKKT